MDFPESDLPDDPWMDQISLRENPKPIPDERQDNELSKSSKAHKLQRLRSSGPVQCPIEELMHPLLGIATKRRSLAEAESTTESSQARERNGCIISSSTYNHKDLNDSAS
jgi:hypothetical protein